ncbi:hypothetical protein [Coleofasciculus sp. FACHB-SPT36]|uniref:hypothetical protein n=1 Tax=Cyanophyceae TaxID=3028117 RepID=UPI00168AC3EB|nr:hypothetical protein [Coleofasciculus sp. FACHB-SPT36]MBD2537723.1 hypothetical protein [Coleofasciculus sp. FACHB-SPT36]
MRRIRLLALATISFVATLVGSLFDPVTFLHRLLAIALSTVFTLNLGISSPNADSASVAVAAHPPAIQSAFNNKLNQFASESQQPQILASQPSPFERTAPTNYCGSGTITKPTRGIDTDTRVYSVFYDFSRGQESVNSAACGREYWIPAEQSNPYYGLVFVYWVDGYKNRVSSTRYVETNNGTLIVWDGNPVNPLLRRILTRQDGNQALSHAIARILNWRQLRRIQTASIPQTLINNQKQASIAAQTASTSASPSPQTSKTAAQNYCGSGRLTQPGKGVDRDGRLYYVFHYFNRVPEKVNPAACGREYWIPVERSNPNYGLVFAYLVDGQKNRVSSIRYVETRKRQLIVWNGNANSQLRRTTRQRNGTQVIFQNWFRMVLSQKKLMGQGQTIYTPPTTAQTPATPPPTPATPQPVPNTPQPNNSLLIGFGGDTSNVEETWMHSLDVAKEVGLPKPKAASLGVEVGWQPIWFGCVAGQKTCATTDRMFKEGVVPVFIVNLITHDVQSKKTWAEIEARKSWYFSELDRLAKDVLSKTQGTVYVSLEPEHNLVGTLRDPVNASYGWDASIPQKFGQLMAEAAQRLRTSASSVPGLNLKVGLAFGDFNASPTGLQNYLPDLKAAAPGVDFFGFQVTQGPWRNDGNGCQRLTPDQAKLYDMPDRVIAIAQFIQTQLQKPSLIDYFFLMADAGTDWDEGGAKVYQELQQRSLELQNAGLIGLLHFTLIDTPQSAPNSYWCDGEKNRGIIKPAAQLSNFSYKRPLQLKKMGKALGDWIDAQS